MDCLRFGCFVFSFARLAIHAGENLRAAFFNWISLKVERAMGIEPTWPVWKTGTLPLSYARNRGKDISASRGIVNPYNPTRRFKFNP